MNNVRGYAIGFGDANLMPSATVEREVTLTVPYIPIGLASNAPQSDVVVTFLRIGTGATPYAINEALNSPALSEKFADAMAAYSAAAELAGVPMQEQGYPMQPGNTVRIGIRYDGATSWLGAVDLLGLTSDSWLIEE
jgi:hypothetical protein